MPPQYCRHASGISLANRPAFNFTIEAIFVTLCPIQYWASWK